MLVSAIVKWTIVTLIVIGALSTVALIGKPRKPITPGGAVLALSVNALLVLGIVLCWES